MSTYATNRAGGGGGVSGLIIEPNFASFPPIGSVPNGTLIKDAGSHILYEYNSTTLAYEPIASNAAYLAALASSGSPTVIGPIDSEVTPSANGATIAAGQLIMQSASATVPGLVNNTTQVFSGQKTLNNDIHTGYSQYNSIAQPATPAAGTQLLYATPDPSGLIRMAVETAAGNQLILAQDQEVATNNASGATITRGQAVVVNGALGGIPTVTLAQANTLAGSLVFGLVLSASTTNGSTGHVQFSGELTSVDTSAFTVGATLYLSDVTPGALTATAPAFPSFVTKVGTVLTSNATTGSILISIVNAVATPFPVNQVPFYFIATASADVATYDQLQTTPSVGATVTFTSTGATTKTLMKSFATPISTPGVTQIPAGTWVPTIWASTSTSAGSNIVTVDVFKRSQPGGVETLLFTVDTPQLTGAIVGYNIPIAQPTIAMLSSDRLVFKVSGTSSVAAHTLTFYTQNTTNNSFVSSPLSAATGVVLTTQIDQPNGVAGLDGAGLLRFTEFPVMPAHTYVANVTGASAQPTFATRTQVTADLNLFTAGLQGLTPASGGGTLNFLRADGTFAAPPGATSGTVTSVSVVTANGLAGTVATATTTPAITLSTTLTTPVIAGNGTALIAATTTGTGSTVVLNAGPTFTGTIAGASETLSGTLVATGAISGSNLTAGGHAILDLQIANNLSDVASPATSFNNISPMTTVGDTIYEITTGVAARLPIGATANVLTVVGGLPAWVAPATSGTVTSVSVATINGFAGTVATPTTTPVISVSTTLTTPVIAGNGTAIIAATTTGTGSTVVLNAGPTFTGTIAGASETLSGTLAATGTISGSNLTVAGHASADIPESVVTATGDILYATGSAAVTRLAIGTSGQILAVAAGIPSWITGATGTVTSVALAAPAFLTVSGSPVTTSGTLTLTLATQAAGTFLAGPTSGAAAAPTFRALQVPTSQKFTTGTGATYTTPAGVLWLRVTVIGGGAGGGGGSSSAAGAGGGGGGGGGAAVTFIATPTATYTYSVGAGGTGGSGATNPGGTGGNGGVSNFINSSAVTVASTTGGSGGGGGTGVTTGPGSGGAGGAATVGTVTLGGGGGQGGITGIAATVAGTGGAGGTAAGPYSGGGGQSGNGNTGGAGQNYGGGGGGGGGVANAGSGSAGLVFVEEYYQ